MHWSGFIVKPREYVQYMTKEYKKLQQESAGNGDRLHAILMDSDTLFSGISSVSQLWNKYDCIRQGKDLVLATETSCWVGK